jgi:hypothetical protein
MFKEKNCVMSEENEALDIFQKGDLAAADEILAPDFIWRNPSLPSELKHGPEGVKKIASAIINAMPSRQITHEDTNDWYT